MTNFQDIGIPDVVIPSSDDVRLRLAALLTEADILRRLLPVCKRAEAERDRIQKLVKDGPEDITEKGTPR